MASAIELYDAQHPEYGMRSHETYFGRYSYVLLTRGGANDRRIALLEALLNRFVGPGESLTVGVPTDVDNTLDFNLFEIPLSHSIHMSPPNALGRKAAALLENAYGWRVAESIRNAYCSMHQHMVLPGICASPRDDGPFIITFFAPVPELRHSLEPALAYDFSNDPPDSAITDSTLLAIQTRINVPAGVSADSIMPPSMQLKVAAVLDGIDHGLVGAITIYNDLKGTFSTHH